MVLSKKKKLFIIIAIFVIGIVATTYLLLNRQTFDTRSNASENQSVFPEEQIIISHPQYISFRKAYTAKEGNTTGYPAIVSSPSTIVPGIWTEIKESIGSSGSSQKKIATTYMFLALDSNIDNDLESIRKIFSQAKQDDSPFVLNLMVFSWWNNSPSLWNFWDPSYSGYSLDNINNVEWTSTSERDAVKIAWRDWGKEIAIAPQPNLASEEYRSLVEDRLNRYMEVIEQEYLGLTPEEKFLFAGLDIGNEFSVGPNFYYYEYGHLYNYISHKQGIYNVAGLTTGCTGIKATENENCNVQELGFKAALDMQLINEGQLSLTSDIKDQIVLDYANFVGSVLKEYPVIPSHKIFAHAVAWDSKTNNENTAKTGIVDYMSPGWSFYKPESRNPQILNSLLIGDNARDPWGTTEWLPQVNTVEEWEGALNNTLEFKNNKLINIANWEGIFKVNDTYENNNALQAIHNVILSESNSCFNTPSLIQGIANYDGGTAIKISKNALGSQTRLIGSTDKTISPDGKLLNINFINEDVTGESYTFIDNDVAKSSIYSQRYYLQLITVGCDNSKREFSEVYEVMVNPFTVEAELPLIFVSTHKERAYFSWSYQDYDEQVQAIYFTVSISPELDSSGQLKDFNIVNERISDLTSYTRMFEYGKIYYIQIAHDALGERFLSPVIPFSL